MTPTLLYPQLLELPPVEDQEKKPKRPAGVPNLDYLKPQQREAFDHMLAFLLSEEGRMFTLLGFAGTGKTTTIGYLIEYMLDKQRTVQIAMTAPTNKAVKVMRNKADYAHENLDYQTIHRLLGLKEVIDAYGNQKFLPDYTKPQSISEKHILVVDEASMLSDELFKMIEPFCDSIGLRIIFMGDPAQIPPVGFPDSIPMQANLRQKHGIKSFALTDIVRQAAGNPIIETTFEIRKNLDTPNPLIRRDTELNGSQGVLFLRTTGEADMDLLEAVMEKYFMSPNFKQNSDFVKLIGWRNKTVDMMNARIRKYIYGDNPARIEIGEKLIADKPIIDKVDDTIIFTTNDEMEVLEVTEEMEEINNGEITLKYYSTIVQSMENPGREPQVIKIIHEDSDKQYNDILSTLREYAKMQFKGSIAAKKGWEAYYGFMEHFAQVKYNYAITAHKSQGSTYDTAIVLSNDIGANRNIREKNRILYTSASRPSGLLIVVR